MNQRRTKRPTTPFSDRLQAARILCGLSQTVFSQMIGVSQSVLAAWEVGKAEPSIAHLQRISVITGVSLDLLIGGFSQDQIHRFLPPSFRGDVISESRETLSGMAEIGEGSHATARSPIKGHIEEKTHPLKITHR